SFLVHAAVMIVLAAGAALAPALALREGRNPYDRVLGWKHLAETVRAELRRAPYEAVLADDRWVTAELLYYLRDLDTPVRSWRYGEIPRDHFELTRPYAGSEEPVLLVTLRPSAEHVTSRFVKTGPLGEKQTTVSPGITRPAWLWALSGYRGN
ncbi:MAG: hypothetical protein AB7U38_14425, partial [Hyphomicrobiales bacterium]